MGFNKKTIKDINLAKKTILLRADYNVPVGENGVITDDYRIQQSLPTLRYLLDQNCKIVICSHLGRPKNDEDTKTSLQPVAKRLGELLKQDVHFTTDCIGPLVKSAADNLKNGEVLLLENLRYHKEEEANDDDFARQLAEVADVFVQDGFGVVHRAHASTDAITKHLPSVAGFLLEKEVNSITSVIEKPVRPLMAIVGGAKISDKMEVLTRLIEIADFVVVGGAMANTFLLAEDIDIGKSLAEPDELPLAKKIMKIARAKSQKQQFIFYLPQDGVVANAADSKSKTRIVDWDAQIIADIEAYPKQPSRKASQIQPNEMILDIGPFSASFVAGGMQLARTVIWNGTLGVTEIPALNDPVGPFARGTSVIVEAMLGQHGNRPFTLVGGGDTVGYVHQRQLTELFDHVSTGGGATLELMAGKKLPGLECLLDK